MSDYFTVHTHEGRICTGDCQPTAAEVSDTMRERLGAALPADLQPVGVRFRWPEAFGEDDPLTGYGSLVVDALLPTVRAIVADELRAAADEAHGEAYTEPRLPWQVLRDRADALDPR